MSALDWLGAQQALHHLHRSVTALGILEAARHRLSAPRDAPVRTCWRALTEPLRSPVAATWPDAYLRCFSGKPTVTRARSVALMGVEGRRRTARSTAAGLLGLSLVAIANAQPVPQGSPIPRVAPSAPVPTAPPELPAPLAPPTALPALNAVVTAVEIDGVTAYPEARLRALASGLVGDHTPLREIESVRRAILLLYRNDGYPFVVVSARLDRQGRLRFAVSEGYIADVKLAGDVGPVGSLVLRFLSHLTEQRPINNATIEHWVLLAQTIPGVQISRSCSPRNANRAPSRWWRGSVSRPFPESWRRTMMPFPRAAPTKGC